VIVVAGSTAVPPDGLQMPRRVRKLLAEDLLEVPTALPSDRRPAHGQVPRRPRRRRGPRQDHDEGLVQPRRGGRRGAGGRERPAAQPAGAAAGAAPPRQGGQRR